MRNKQRVLLLLNAYDQPTHEAAVAAARKYNWHLDTNILTPMSMLNQWRGSGILCSLTDNPRTEHVVIQNQDLPCVDLSSWREDLKLPRVAADNVSIGKMAAWHFLSYGHRNFAWYASSPTPFGETRFQAFDAEIRKNGCSVERIDGYGSLNYATMAERLRALPRPCAIFAVNDADAGWLASLCLEEGMQVPLDIAILGVDNNPLICDVHSTPLSSIERNTKAIVLKGADLLQRAMEGEKVPAQTTLISPKGVIARASSDAYVTNDELVRAALSYLQNHLAEKTGAPEIAAELGVSRSLLNQRFQAATQTTLHQTLMRMRQNRAAELLIYTRWNMNRIATETGFTHASHLSNSFKKNFGKSPLQYRRENQ